MRIMRACRRLLHGTPHPALSRRLIVLRDAEALRHAMGWSIEPRIDADAIDRYEYPEDANHRRLRDAEVVATVVANTQGPVLEIGTSHGEMTVVMAAAAGSRTVHTLDLPPHDPGGGKLVTHRLAAGQVGSAHRAAGCSNVVQSYGDSAAWTPPPELSGAGAVLIDGCHDADYVVGDTELALRILAPGGVVLWHDFAPPSLDRCAWVHEVMDGVDRVCRRRLVDGPIFHVADSWFGLMRVP